MNNQSIFNSIVENETSLWTREIQNQKIANQLAANQSLMQTFKNSTSVLETSASANGGATIDVNTSNASASDIPEELPVGSSYGDMLTWNGAEWIILPRPSGTKLYVLAINPSTNQIPYWQETQDCEE